jgi:hypothetical protein
MKKLLSLALLCAALPTQAAINDLDNVPAATLLLPYFDVDTNNASGTRTVFTVGNAQATEVLAHVTLWTDRGVPSLNFNLRLAGYDVAEIDLRELIVNGTLPASTAGGFASCAGQLPAANLSATQITGLRNAHTGIASSTFGGQCGGVAYGDGHARGYVTVDTVSACTNLVPGDAGYFVLGGTGIATNNNALWGEQSTFNASRSSAYGDTLVHIEASATDPATDGAAGPDYTFYGRRVNGTAADNREGLPQAYMGRFSFLGVIDGTTAQVWRDPGIVSPFACATPPAGLGNQPTGAFDYQEQVSLTRPVGRFAYATQAVDLANPMQAAVPFTLGFVLYDLGLPAAAAPFGNLNQGHVSHVLTSSVGNAGQTSAWPLVPINEFYSSPFGFSPFPECSDGIDNDSDGRIDFPADPQCVSATSLSENPQCGDGLDNDGDLLVDFPADPECSNVRDPTENNIEQACRDGFDNDGDGLIDFPADPGCTSPGDFTETALCENGIDDDMDGRTDFPADRGCSTASDNDETDNICNDGLDNDMDGRTDFPADPGCQSLTSFIENPQCNNTTDDDADTLIDFPADLGCTAAFDNSEANAICMDGLDNDTDGLIDFPADPGCASATSNQENPQCNNGIDNDGDGLIDFPADPGCSSASDTSEGTAQCADGRDNDGDGVIDFPLETGCQSTNDDFEGPDCAVADTTTDFMGGSIPFDNDLDGLANFGNDPGCASATDPNELSGSVTRSCSDGIDNDGDLLTDYPADTGCTSAYDDLEFVPGEVQGVPTAVPTLSTLGMLLAAAMMLLVGGFGLHRRRVFSR